MDDDQCTPERCFIPAPRFHRWWRKLNELWSEDPNDKDYDRFLAALTNLGLHAGALTRTRLDEPSVINKDFDWEHGKIDFAPLSRPEWYGKYNSSLFIAQLQQVTGLD